MNPKSFFNLFSPKGIGQSLIPQQVSSLAISLAVLSLFVLTACLQVPASVPVIEEALQAVAPAAVIETEPAVESASLAANPELLPADAPTEVHPSLSQDIEAVRQQNFLSFKALEVSETGQPLSFDIEHLSQIYDANWGIEADSPDVHRPVQPIKGNGASEPPTFDIEHLRQIYDANWASEAGTVNVNPVKQSSAFLAANPELAVASRYRAVVETSRAETLDLEAFRRQSFIAREAFNAGVSVQENVVGELSSFDIEHLRQIYDANWGVEAAAPDVRRFREPIKGNGASEPPTFDIEHLRQIYDANWSIEAGTVDLNPADRSSFYLAAYPMLTIAGRYKDEIEQEVLPPQSYAGFLDKNALDTFLEANPELRFARSRLVTAIDEAGDSTFLATNPEISSARRYMTAAWIRHHFEIETSPSIFLAANPELSSAYRYTAVKNEAGTQAFYDIEVVRHKNFMAIQILKAEAAAEKNNEAGVDSTSLATNPEFIEIMRIRRDATAAETRAEAALLATNPELMVAGRYEAMVEWSRLHHPGR